MTCVPLHNGAATTVAEQTQQKSICNYIYKFMFNFICDFMCNQISNVRAIIRPAQIAELPRSKFDPELYPDSAYVEIFVTFATKVPYLTFCNKM